MDKKYRLTKSKIRKYMKNITMSRVAFMTISFSTGVRAAQPVQGANDVDVGGLFV